MRSFSLRSQCYATEAMPLELAGGSDLLCGNQIYTVELAVLATS